MVTLGGRLLLGSNREMPELLPRGTNARALAAERANQRMEPTGLRVPPFREWQYAGGSRVFS